jgi:hypothetical protein
MKQARFLSLYDDIQGRPTKDYRDAIVEILGPVELHPSMCEEEIEIARDQRRVRFPDGWEAVAWIEELHPINL